MRRFTLTLYTDRSSLPKYSNHFTGSIQTFPLSFTVTIFCVHTNL